MRNYGTGAYGAGNYSAMTAAVLAGARGAFGETGEGAGLTWRAVLGAAWVGFGMTGEAVGLAVTFGLGGAPALLILARSEAGFQTGTLWAAAAGESAEWTPVTNEDAGWSPAEESEASWIQP